MRLRGNNKVSRRADSPLDGCGTLRQNQNTVKLKPRPLRLKSSAPGDLEKSAIGVLKAFAKNQRDVPHERHSRLGVLITPGQQGRRVNAGVVGWDHRGDGGTAGLSRKERPFAEDFTGTECVNAHVDARGDALDADTHASLEDDVEVASRFTFLDDGLANVSVVDLGKSDDGTQMLLGKSLEDGEVGKAPHERMGVVDGFLRRGAIRNWSRDRQGGDGFSRPGEHG